jgi:prophage protein DUF1660
MQRPSSLVKLRCRLVGHKTPGRKRFLLATDGYQRCERCGERVLVSKL